MTDRSKAKLIGIIVTCIFIAFGIFYLIRSQLINAELSKGFPAILPGAYVGTVKLSLDDKQISSSLYIERLRDGNTLLFLVFLKDFQPQTIFSQKLTNTPAGDQERYRPITLYWNDLKLIFSGKEDKGSITGIVKINTKNVGTWDIRRMTPEETISISLGDSEEKILLWLRAKERLRKNTLDRNNLSREITAINEKITILKEALGDKQLLQSRSIERRKELEAKFAALKVDKEKKTAEMEKLVSSLELLSRITKRGQSVSLERKILQREIRWYDVHWQSDEDTTELSEDETGMDFIKLDAALRKAKETKSLIRERDDELLRVRELTEELNNPQPVSSDTPESPEKPEEDKRELWDRLFG